MATLSCLEAIKNRERSTITIQDLPLPRKERVRTNQLYDIEVIEEDVERDMAT